MVIPVRNEVATIDRLLESLRAQTRPPDEILVVDGGSTDGTPAAVDAWGSQGVRLLRVGPASPGRGRNLGIAAAKHEWIALTDAGIVADSHWLERLERAAIPSSPGSDVRIVFGSFEPRRSTFFERCADLAYVQPLVDSRVGPIRSDSIASCLLHRALWEQVGGFPDLRAAEDRLFLRAVRALGIQFAFAPEARVTWQLAPTPLATWSRFRSYSRHNVLANEQRNWHYGVARQWAVGAAVLLAAALRRKWSLVLLIPGGAIARGVRSVGRRREGRSWWWVARPAQLAGVIGTIGLIDLATFLGWLDGVRELRRHEARRAQ